MALHLTLDGEKHSIEIVQRRPRLRLKVDGCEYEIANETSGATAVSISTTRGSISRAPSRTKREKFASFASTAGRTKSN